MLQRCRIARVCAMADSEGAANPAMAPFSLAIDFAPPNIREIFGNVLNCPPGRMSALMSPHNRVSAHARAYVCITVYVACICNSYKGLSIKYVTLFLDNFSPLLPPVTLCHTSQDPLKYVTHLGTHPPIFSRP